MVIGDVAARGTERVDIRARAVHGEHVVAGRQLRTDAEEGAWSDRGGCAALRLLRPLTRQVTDRSDVRAGRDLAGRGLAAWRRAGRRGRRSRGGGGKRRGGGRRLGGRG